MAILKTLTVNGTRYNVTPVVPAPSVTLLAEKWEGNGDKHQQVVAVSGATDHTKVDLQPESDQLAELRHLALSLVAENEGGVVTVYAVGNRPTKDYTFQVTLTEVDGTGKIRGDTVGISPPLSAGGDDNDLHALEDMIRDLADRVAELHYEPIDITSCYVSPSTVELGANVDSVTVTWALNKEPASQSVEGEVVDIAKRSKKINLSERADKSFTVKAQDEQGAEDTATAWLRFYNGVYYGTLDASAVINSAAILRMTRSLQPSKVITFTATASAGQKFAYALPSRYGTPAFNVGGFDYVWTKAATFDFTNGSGHTEEYVVWVNDEVVVGTRTIKVT